MGVQLLLGEDPDAPAEPLQPPQPAAKPTKRARASAKPKAEVAAPAEPTLAPEQGECVDVWCEGSGKLGLLSYLCDPALKAQQGDAVLVPFGTRSVVGVIVGPGERAKATRWVEQVYGKRASDVELRLAAELAARHFCAFASVAPRLAPKKGRGKEPLDAGAPVLAAGPDGGDALLWGPGIGASRRLVLRAPLVSPARLAARLAMELLGDGSDTQVLVLCPTTELVTKVCREFASGAARLDAKAPEGAWSGLVAGSLRVGVGTRSAALYEAKNLAGIVVVEEDHPGHQEAQQPHWNVRDVASARASARNVPLALTSAAPSAAAIGAGVKVCVAGGREAWPNVKLIDRREYTWESRELPPPAKGALKKALDAGHHPLVVATRLKAVRRCAGCGFARPCHECESATCPHREESACPSCHRALGVRMVGFDVERLTKAVGEGAVVVLPSELGKYKNAGCVVMMDIDAPLRSMKLDPESALAALVSVAGAAAGPEGEVVLLTSEPGHEALRALARADLLGLAQYTWAHAQELGLPPFKRLVSLTVGQDRAPVTRGWPGLVLGPRRVGQEWELLVRLDNSELGRLAPHVERLRRGGRVRLTVS